MGAICSRPARIKPERPRWAVVVARRLARSAVIKTLNHIGYDAVRLGRLRAGTTAVAARRYYARRRLAAIAEEGLAISGELRVMLEQEPVRRVRVDLHPSLRDQAGQQVRVMRQDHRVAVAVGHEDRQVDGAQPLQQGVIGDTPGTNRVVLSLARLPGCCLVPVLCPGEHPL